MRTLLIASLAVLLGCVSAPSRHDLLIRNASVLDVETGEVSSGMTIAVDDGIITALGPLRGAEAERVIDAGGRLVTPGLIDTHVHLLLIYGDGGFGPEALTDQDRDLLGRRFLQHGVTTIADMGQPGGWLPRMIEWQNRPAPDAPALLVAAGSLGSELEWDRRPPQHHDILGSPGQARTVAESFADLGAERLKLYWKLEEPEARAIMDVVRERELLPYAHFGNRSLTIGDGLDLGVRHFEHVFTLPGSITDIWNQDEKIAARFGNPPEPETFDQSVAQWNFHLPYIMGDEELAADFGELLGRMASAGASLSTGLNMQVAAAGRSPVFSAFEPYPPRSSVALGYDEEQKAILDEAVDETLRAMKYIADSGVSLRIGTDAANGGEVMLSELTLLVEGGFSPEEAFRIATMNGAEALGIAGETGRVAPGFRADLVIFGENPLDDIANVFSEKTVLRGGAVYEPPRSFAEAFGDVLAEGDAAEIRAWFAEAQNDPAIGPVHPAETMALFHRHLDRGEAEKAALVAELAPRDLIDSEVDFGHVKERQMLVTGQRFLNGGNAEAGRSVFDLTARLFEGSATAHAASGLASLQLGDEEEARAALRRAREIAPDNPVAASLAGQLD
jgi:hypothetical protein